MKKISLLLLTLILSITLISRVNALEITKVGNIFTDEGEYDSIRLTAGNAITSKAAVNGIHFVAGNQITIDGISEYGFFAGNMITINGKINKDLFVAGNNITISKTTEIGRDLFIAGDSIIISANLNRDLRAGGTVIDIRGITINGDAYIDSENIMMDENTVINGKLTYIEKTNIEGLDKATIGSVTVEKNNEKIIKYTFWTEVKIFLINYCAAVIVMIALLFVIPAARDRLNNTSLETVKIFKTALLGFAALVIIPIVSGIILLTGILTPLALIIIAIYIICIYLSTLVAAYVLGNWITTKYISKESKYLAILIGVLIVKLLGYIPKIGSLFTAFALLYGMGLIYKFIASRKENK